MHLNLNYESLFMSKADYMIFLFENDFKCVLPELFLTIVTLLLLIFGVIFSTSKKNNYPLILYNLCWLSLYTLFFAITLLVNNPIVNSVIFYNTLLIDDFTFFFKFLTLLGVFFSIYISIHYMKQESLNSYEFIILILLSTCSMLFLISSADFISMYLAIEMQSLCFYVLAALKRNSEFSTEAGLKYFLLGAFSSGLLLFGCSMIYGFSGSTNFSDLSKLFIFDNEEISTFHTSGYDSLSFLHACELGMIFILVGFLFKITAAPFHMWAPDVYEGSPTSVTAFFSIAPKIAVLSVFLRIFLESFLSFIWPWQKILIFCSVTSMIIGSFAAMSQNKIKRLLAFSSIGHVGFLLIGFCCGTVEGLQSLIIYLVIYTLMTINFFCFILLPLRRDFRGVVNRIKYTTDLALLAKTNPLLALNLTLTLFSMAGIPPLAGFYSKAFLFFAAVSSSMYFLAVIGVLTSVISCFYYIRIIKIMYFESITSWCSFIKIPRENSITLAITSLFISFFIIYPSPLYLISHKIALIICL